MTCEILFYSLCCIFERFNMVNINEVWWQLCWNGLPYKNFHYQRFWSSISTSSQHSMLAELFKAICLLFTMLTVKYANRKFMKIMLEYMFYPSIIFNMCCLFLGLYQRFCVSLPLWEDKIYLSNQFINYIQSKNYC